MSNFGDKYHEINCCIGKVSAAFNQLRKILEEPEADPYNEDEVLQNQCTADTSLWV